MMCVLIVCKGLTACSSDNVKVCIAVHSYIYEKTKMCKTLFSS